jgi:hypothetical protein
MFFSFTSSLYVCNTALFIPGSFHFLKNRCLFTVLVLLFVSFIILQDDFDSTLTGTMGALAEIQRKRDNMLAGIRRQREVLDMLERKAEQAERRREQAEVLARQMENEKQNLEDKVLELKAEKNTLMGEMKEDEMEMIRLV